MNDSFQKQLDLWQLSIQTSRNCWLSFNLRCSLFVTQSPVNLQVVEESSRMVGEKLRLSADILARLASINSIAESFEAQNEIQCMINDKALENINRLKGQS